MIERLNKHLALVRGISRRAADELIEQGKVAINGTQAILGARFNPATDTITINGKPLTAAPAFRYLTFHKPVGYVCSRRAQGDNPTIYSLLPPELHTLKPVGRLDRDSSGLLLLTNDGDFAYRMTHPKFYKTKVYEVDLDHALEPLHRQMISDFGVMLPDGKSKFELERLGTTAPVRVTAHRAAPAFEEIAGDFSKEGTNVLAGPADSDLRADVTQSETSNDGSGNIAHDTRWRITMHEGRNRQIRRTFAALGYEVRALHRTHFGDYSLGDIKPGSYADVDMR